MAREEELKRIDLKVNVSCCEGCRRKVMKAMSVKGVLRTEIKPSHDRVSVVGDVDAKVLVKKLARIGKIAEVLPPPSCFDEDGGKKRDDGGKKQQDGGDKPAPAAEEKSRGKDDDDKLAAACKEECKKCASHGAADGDKACIDNNKNTVAKEKAPPSKRAEEGNDGFHGAKSSSAPAHMVAVQQFQHYHRAEPAMVVPVHVPPYYPPPPPCYGGYYAAPPPPPMMMMGMPRRAAQLRPQPSRFDADYFNDDNTVGCSVM